MIWFGYSGLPKSLARSGWYLYVSPSLFFRDYAVRTVLSRWEFVTTLDYEWRVFRGQLPRRWTIYVRDDRLLNLGFRPQGSLGLIYLFNRSTPSHA
jgi:hypothetical protein